MFKPRRKKDDLKKQDMQCQSYMHRPKFEIKQLGLFKMLASQNGQTYTLTIAP